MPQHAQTRGLALAPRPGAPPGALSRRYSIGEQQLVLMNYEAFHQLPKGSATLRQVASSAAGIDGWSNPIAVASKKKSPLKVATDRTALKKKSSTKVANGSATSSRLQQAKEAVAGVKGEQMLASTQALPSEEDTSNLAEHEFAQPVAARDPAIDSPICVLVNSVGGETVEVQAHSGELVPHLQRRIEKAIDKPLTQLALAHDTDVLHGMQRVGEVFDGSIGDDDGEVVDGAWVERVEISTFRSQEGGPVKELMHFDDAQGLAEYAPDLYVELKNEESKVKICPDFLQRQTVINGPMRAHLVNLLLDLHMRYRLRPVTLFLAVNILDRYLQANSIEIRMLQLIACVSFMLAAKFEEIHPPEMKEIPYVCDYAYSMKDVCEMEVKILTALAFNMTVPTAAHFMDLYQPANRCDKKHCFVVQYLLELTLGEEGMIGEIPSKAAAAATLLSNSLLGREVCWPEAMASYTGYSEVMLENVVHKMRQLHSSARTNNLQVVRRFSHHFGYDPAVTFLQVKERTVWLRHCVAATLP